MWKIDQTDAGWTLTAQNGMEIPFATYDEALAALSKEVAAAAPVMFMDPAGDNADGLLPESWTSVDGICFAEPTGPERDFSNVTWSWRDPTVSTMPLMFQSSTEMGHFAAELAGYFETIGAAGGTVAATGRFYDNDPGRALRDLLLNGRTFGVSVDPGENTVAEMIPTEFDDDGWPTSFVTDFTEYEIIGMTATPFPGFARAAITLDTGEAAAPASAAETAPSPEAIAAATRPKWNSGGIVTPAVALGSWPAQVVVDKGEAFIASGTANTDLTLARTVSNRPMVLNVPARPPAAWLTFAEPQEGDDLVPQEDGTLAVPLTILDDGQVYGHLARWGQCHTGYDAFCQTPPESSDDYRGFHIGATVCDDGTQLATGPLTVGCDHAAATLRAPEARDFYAHAGMAWADVRISNGTFGPWCAGALRPDVTDDQLRVLRASALSGDWRDLGTGRLELVAALTVNSPGFPIQRALAASAGIALAAPGMRVGRRGGKVTALVASGLVQRCPECEKRRRAAVTAGQGDREGYAGGIIEKAVLKAVRSEFGPALEVLLRRTEHLNVDAVTAAAARIRR